jgi:hypothetical protein
MTKELETIKAREAVALARQIAELRRELKCREKDMSLEEFVAMLTERETVSNGTTGPALCSAPGTWF